MVRTIRYGGAHGNVAPSDLKVGVEYVCHGVVRKIVGLTRKFVHFVVVRHRFGLNPDPEGIVSRYQFARRANRVFTPHWVWSWASPKKPGIYYNVRPKPGITWEKAEITLLEKRIGKKRVPWAMIVRADREEWRFDAYTFEMMEYTIRAG